MRALVALYGHLQFIVSVGSGSIDKSVTTTYRVDQLGGAHRLDAPEDRAIAPPPFRRYSRAEYSKWLKVMEASMHKIMPIVMEKQREHAVHAMVEKSLEEVLAPADGTPITQKQLRRVAHSVAERYVNLLTHEGVFDDSALFDENGEPLYDDDGNLVDDLEPSDVK